MPKLCSGGFKAMKQYKWKKYIKNIDEVDKVKHDTITETKTCPARITQKKTTRKPLTEETNKH